MNKRKPHPELHLSPGKAFPMDELTRLHPDAELINFKDLGKHLLGEIFLLPLFFRWAPQAERWISYNHSVGCCQSQVS